MPPPGLDADVELDVEPVCLCAWLKYGEAGTDGTRWEGVFIEFCRLMSGRVTSMLGLLELWLWIEVDWSLGAATPETEVAFWAASRMLRALRVERFEEER